MAQEKTNTGAENREGEKALFQALTWNGRESLTFRLTSQRVILIGAKKAQWVPVTSIADCLVASSVDGTPYLRVDVDVPKSEAKEAHVTQIVLAFKGPNAVSNRDTMYKLVKSHRDENHRRNNQEVTDTEEKAACILKEELTDAFLNGKSRCCICPGDPYSIVKTVFRALQRYSTSVAATEAGGRQPSLKSLSWLNQKCSDAGIDTGLPPSGGSAAAK